MNSCHARRLSHGIAMLAVLLIAASPLGAQIPNLVVSSTSLTFSQQVGGVPPASQVLTVSSSGSSMSFTAAASTASGGSWLSVTPTAWVTEGKLSVSVNPAGLVAGIYNGTIVLTSGVAANSPLNVPVTLVVSSGPLLAGTPASLSFNYQAGEVVPPAQTVAISSSGAPLNFSVAASTASGGNWLSAVPAGGTTPASVQVSINPALVPVGTYTGSVVVTAVGSSNTLTIPVTMAVSAAPFFSVAPGSVTFNYTVGGASPPEQILTVTSSGQGMRFTVAATTSSGGAWLAVTPTEWYSPGSLSAMVNPTGLNPGTYNGTITVTMPGATNSPQAVAVSLVVAGSPLMSVSPGSLTVNYQLGGPAPASQTFNVTSSGAPFAFAAAATTATGGNWLSVTPTAGTTPASVQVTANPTGLALGTYTGTVTLTASGASNSPQTVAVTLVVSATPLMAVTPSSLGFVYQVGGAMPSAQVLNISSSGTVLSYIASSSTSSGGNWLRIDPVVGATPGTVGVSVNPAGLPVGSYAGSVTVASPGASNSPQTVAVSLTVSNSPFLLVTPNTLSFSYQTGGAAPSGQFVVVSGTSSGMTFTATPTTTSGGNWLAVSPANGITPAIFTVTVNATGLQPGTYNGSIAIASTGAANTPQNVAVTLVVSGTPVLTANPTSLSFDFQPGGAAPAAQNVVIGSSTGSLGFTVTTSTAAGGNWLGVGAASGTTPATLSVTVNPVGLPAGTYQGSITLTPGQQGAPLTVPVTLVVAPGLALTATPASLTFNHQVGTNPPASQKVTIGSSGAVLSFTASVSTSSGGNWLAASPASGNTTSDLTVIVNPAGLATGTYTGTINVVSAGATNSPLAVPVTLVVGTNPFLAANPATFSFTAFAGGLVPAAQNLSVTSSSTALTFAATISTTAGGNWLAVTPASGATPATLSVAVNPASLPVGSYTGTITITSGGAANSPVTVTVSFVVNASVTLAAAPASLAFSYQVGGSAPAVQAMNITTSGAALSFTASASTTSGGGWLTVNPPGAAAPATLSVGVNPASLGPGSYTGAITITATGASNSPLTIPVTLVVTSSVALTVSPGSLAFSYQTGGTAPADQTLSISTSGAALNFTAATATTTGGNWLAITPSGGGTTPTTLKVSVSTVGLSPGNYNGTVTIASTGAVNSPQTINVTLTVTAAVPPVALAVVNAASWNPGPIAPGEIVTIGGTDMGGASTTKMQLDANGLAVTTLADTRVFFDNVPAALVYVSKTLASAVVPYAMAGRAEVQMQVEYKGIRSAAVQLRVADTAPGIFSLSSDGRGPGAILNQDFSVNLAANPADKGSIVMIYATGEGQTDPAGVDGRITQVKLLPKPLASVTVQIGSKTADVTYAGGAPGNVSGVIQINAKIPPDAPSGAAVPITVTIGGVSSQSGLTIAIK